MIDKIESIRKRDQFCDIVKFEAIVFNENTSITNEYAKWEIRFKDESCAYTLGKYTQSEPPIWIGAYLIHDSREKRWMISSDGLKWYIECD